MLKESKKLASASVIIVLLLTACGGGTGVEAAAISFPLQSGYKVLIANGSATNFSVTGTCPGTANLTSSKPVNASFEGAPALSVTQTITMSLANCSIASTAVTGLNYFNSDYIPLGHVVPGQGYGKFLTAPAPLPISAKVGDTAIFGTETLYADSTKQTVVGENKRSYVIEADGASATTAVANFITFAYNAANRLQHTQQSRYRIAADGKLSIISIDIQYRDTNTGHLRLTAN